MESEEGVRWRAEIALAGRGDDDDDHLAGALFAAPYFKSRDDRRAAGDSGEDSLLARQPPSHLHRVRILDGDDLIQDIAIQDGWHKGRADPLNLVRPALAAG